MSVLLPVGSLWRHRESGELVFVMKIEASLFTHRVLEIQVAVVQRNGDAYMTALHPTRFQNLAAEADRIDIEPKEEAQ